MKYLSDCLNLIESIKTYKISPIWTDYSQLCENCILFERPLRTAINNISQQKVKDLKNILEKLVRLYKVYFWYFHTRRTFHLSIQKWCIDELATLFILVDDALEDFEIKLDMENTKKKAVEEIRRQASLKSPRINPRTNDVFAPHIPNFPLTSLTGPQAVSLLIILGHIDENLHPILLRNIRNGKVLTYVKEEKDLEGVGVKDVPDIVFKYMVNEIKTYTDDGIPADVMEDVNTCCAELFPGRLGSKSSSGQSIHSLRNGSQDDTTTPSKPGVASNTPQTPQQPSPMPLEGMENVSISTPTAAAVDRTDSEETLTPIQIRKASQRKLNPAVTLPTTPLPPTPLPVPSPVPTTPATGTDSDTNTTTTNTSAPTPVSIPAPAITSPIAVVVPPPVLTLPQPIVMPAINSTTPAVEPRRFCATNNTIKAAVRLYCTNKMQAVKEYGVIQTWNTEKVTDMNGLFRGQERFNEDISMWDVSKVMNMSEMFDGASTFNQPLNDWKVSNVTDMSRMFHGAKAFNQSLVSWDVSKVTTMAVMFSGASCFNQPLASWNVANVADMSYMFANAVSFNQPLNAWGENTQNVSNMSFMFANANKFNQPLHSWKVSNVKNMSSMFHKAIAFNQPLDQWDVSSVMNMSGMFHHAIAFNQPLEQWNVTNVTQMQSMFREAIAFNQPLDRWNVEKVTDMSSMFQKATQFNQPLSSWNFAEKNILYIFYEAKAYTHKPILSPKKNT